nr:hypothetical protein [uncultured Faecalibacillus sp.]
MYKKETNKYQNFTLSLALFDALPVIFFCVAIFLIASRFHNLFFFIVIIFCILTDYRKILWKILVALKGMGYSTIIYFNDSWLLTYY